VTTRRVAAARRNWGTSRPAAGSAGRPRNCRRCSPRARACPAGPPTSWPPSCTRPRTAWPPRKVQDTSRQGRWHNARYRAIAAKLGLDVAQAPAIGWSYTTVPPATAARYAAELGQAAGDMLAASGELALLARRYRDAADLARQLDS
jgi:hypothetical protein